MSEQSTENVSDQEHPTKRHGDALEDVVIAESDAEATAEPSADSTAE